MKTEFTSPDQATIQELESELRAQASGFTISLARRLVVADDKVWLVKYISTHVSDRKRAVKLELLVQSLGDGLVNVATVKHLTEEDIACIKKLDTVELPVDISSQNAILVRVGQKCSKAELTLQDLDTAVAGELVFSVWVRRWDPHSFNRVYNLDNIPVFFDLHIALNEDFRDIAKFFPDDGGVASVWRVKETTTPPTTARYRNDETPNNTHDIYDSGRFKQATFDVAERIISDQRNLRTLVETAGFTGSDVDNLVAYLEETKSTLREDVNKMLKVVLS